VVPQHPLHIEVLHTNDLVLIHQCGGQLMKHSPSQDWARRA
jgi:hypothetical protein